MIWRLAAIFIRYKRINMYMDESEQLYPEQFNKCDYFLSSSEIF